MFVVGYTQLRFHLLLVKDQVPMKIFLTEWEKPLI